jgi:hypothetical protein
MLADYAETGLPSAYVPLPPKSPAACDDNINVPTNQPHTLEEIF